MSACCSFYLAFIAEHDVMWRGISLWSGGVISPGCVLAVSVRKQTVLVEPFCEAQLSADLLHQTVK